MIDLRQAAEMALDYIEQALAQHDQQYQRHPSTERDRQVIVDDLEALRQALAQPEQEPVDWEAVAADQAMTIAMLKLEKRKWVGLTDEKIFEHEWWDEETAFAVNKELKEKNT